MLFSGQHKEYPNFLNEFNFEADGKMNWPEFREYADSTNSLERTGMI